MGERYELDLKCAYCKKLNLDIWYAATCSSDTFICERCNKKNFITSDFKVKKIEKVTYKDIKEGFLQATNASWTEEDIKRICDDRLKQIRKAKNV